MKLATLKLDGGESIGLSLDDGSFLDVASTLSTRFFSDTGLQPVPTTLRALLAADEMDSLRRIRDWIAEASADVIEELVAVRAIVEESDVDFAPPVPHPSLILAQGLAYREHLHEMGVPSPDNPVAFIKASSSLTGHRNPIRLPKSNPDMVDWEGEFAVVIGKGCFAVSEKEALDYVAGYTIINDVSARDWAAAALEKDQPTMQAIARWGENIHGKQFPTFTPAGPVLVTSDEIGDPHQLDVTTRVNDSVMQETNTSDLIFSIPRLISHLSRWYELRSGDLISTGSPSGVGYGRDPRIFLKEGDIVEVTVSGIGTLSNPVIKA